MLLIKNAKISTCSSFVIALQGSSSKFWCLFFFLVSRQGELGILGMTSESTSLPLAMSLPGNYKNKKEIVKAKLQKNKFKYYNTFHID